MLVQLLQACVLTLAGIVLWAYNPVQRFRYRHIPGPKPVPLLGNLPQACTPPLHVPPRACAAQKSDTFCLANR